MESKNQRVEDPRTAKTVSTSPDFGSATALRNVHSSWIKLEAWSFRRGSIERRSAHFPMITQARWATLLPFLYPAAHRSPPRLFSTCRKLQGGDMSSIVPREKPQKSMQVMMKQDPGGSLPKDLGLLEGVL